MDVKYEVTVTSDVCTQTGEVQVVPRRFFNGRQDHSEPRVILC